MKSDKNKLLSLDTLILIGSTIIMSTVNLFMGVFILWIYFVIKTILHRDFICAFNGNLYYHNNNIPKALSWYRRAAKTKVAKPKYITTYAYLELKCGSYQTADETIHSILKNRTFNEEDLFAVKIAQSLVEWKKGNINECVEILENIYIKDYRSLNFFETLGYMLIAKGDLDRALVINLEAYDYSEDSNIISANLGETYYKLGYKDKAEEFLKPLTDENVNFADPYYYTALILNEKNQKEEAISLLTKALTLPDSILTSLTKDKINETLEQIQG